MRVRVKDIPLRPPPARISFGSDMLHLVKQLASLQQQRVKPKHVFQEVILVQLSIVMQQLALRRVRPHLAHAGVLICFIAQAHAITPHACFILLGEVNVRHDDI